MSHSLQYEVGQAALEGAMADYTRQEQQMQSLDIREDR
jgi:hypothetical protein